MSGPSNTPLLIFVNANVRQFRAALVLCAGFAVVFGLSWQQQGLWPLVEGALMSMSLARGGYTLLLMLRVHTLMSASSVRSWMRPTAVGMLIFALVIGASTLWRWHALPREPIRAGPAS
ncbi:MAG: hypothetical protein ABJC26_06850 [Gemmatimonadaceae bacterium]